MKVKIELKKIILFLFLFVITTNAQMFKFGEAKGLFMSIGVGPRFPVGSFAEKLSMGEGIDVAFSYTDNKVLPVFLYSKFGYQHYAGDPDFYRISDYSNFSSNVISLDVGARYYFEPVIKNVVLLMPILEAGLSFSVIENLHQYKFDTHKSDLIETLTKFGFHAGAGFSMFLLDVIGYYHFSPDNQFVSFDLRIRIPIFATI